MQHFYPNRRYIYVCVYIYMFLVVFFLHDINFLSLFRILEMLFFLQPIMGLLALYREPHHLAQLTKKSQLFQLSDSSSFYHLWLSSSPHLLVVNSTFKHPDGVTLVSLLIILIYTHTYKQWLERSELAPVVYFKRAGSWKRFIHSWQQPYCNWKRAY